MTNRIYNQLLAENGGSIPEQQKVWDAFIEKSTRPLDLAKTRGAKIRLITPEKFYSTLPSIARDKYEDPAELGKYSIWKRISSQYRRYFWTGMKLLHSGYGSLLTDGVSGEKSDEITPDTMLLKGITYSDIFPETPTNDRQQGINELNQNRDDIGNFLLQKMDQSNKEYQQNTLANLFESPGTPPWIAHAGDAITDALGFIIPVALANFFAFRKLGGVKALGKVGDATKAIAKNDKARAVLMKSGLLNKYSKKGIRFAGKSAAAGVGTGVSITPLSVSLNALNAFDVGKDENDGDLNKGWEEYTKKARAIYLPTLVVNTFLGSFGLIAPGAGGVLTQTAKDALLKYGASKQVAGRVANIGTGVAAGAVSEGVEEGFEEWISSYYDEKVFGHDPKYAEIFKDSFLLGATLGAILGGVGGSLRRRDVEETIGELQGQTKQDAEEEKQKTDQVINSLKQQPNPQINDEQAKNALSVIDHIDAVIENGGGYDYDVVTEVANKISGVLNEIMDVEPETSAEDLYGEEYTASDDKLGFLNTKAKEAQDIGDDGAYGRALFYLNKHVRDNYQDTPSHYTDIRQAISEGDTARLNELIPEDQLNEEDKKFIEQARVIVDAYQGDWGEASETLSQNNIQPGNKLLKRAIDDAVPLEEEEVVEETEEATEEEAEKEEPKKEETAEKKKEETEVSPGQIVLSDEEKANKRIEKLSDDDRKKIADKMAGLNISPNTDEGFNYRLTDSGEQIVLSDGTNILEPYPAFLCRTVVFCMGIINLGKFRRI